MRSNLAKVATLALIFLSVYGWTQWVSARDARSTRYARAAAVQPPRAVANRARPAAPARRRATPAPPTASYENISTENGLLTLGETSVLLIINCTLRRDRLEHYGYDKSTSPFWKKLSERSVIFDAHVAQASWTRPSLGSIITGHYPRHLALDNPSRNGTLERVLADEFTTIAEIFEANDYLTIGAVGNPNAKTDFGMHQGFERYLEPARVFKDNPRMRSMRELGQFILDETPRDKSPVFAMVMTVDTHERVQFMEQDKAAIQPHYEAVRTEKENATYDASVHYLDRQLGGFIERFLAMRPNTLIIQTADHGEGLRTPVHHGRGHGGYLYPTTVNLPHLWSHPALVQGTRSDTLTRNIDILPTLLELFGIPLSHQVAGRSVAPILRGEVMNESVPGFSESFYGAHNKVAVYDDEYYWILDRNAGTSQLFRSEDYFALDDLLGREPARARDYADLVANWESEWPMSRSVSRVSISDDLRQQLEAIGYVE